MKKDEFFETSHVTFLEPAWYCFGRFYCSCLWTNIWIMKRN